MKNNSIDKDCLKGVQTIIHLAGENVAAGRWTGQRKKRIVDSRTLSTQLLYDALSAESHSIESFISASATGIYGSKTTENIYKESHECGTDFLAKVCVAWEASIFKIQELGIRTVALRTGVVFSKDKGALEKMMIPFKLGFGSSIASGNQYIPWIHIDDLCKMYLFTIERPKIQGAYNAVVGDSLTNNVLSQTLAKTLKRRIIMPNVPGFMLHFIFGEMAIIITDGSRVSSEKIVGEGFQFDHSIISNAVSDLLKS